MQRYLSYTENDKLFETLLEYKKFAYDMLEFYGKKNEVEIKAISENVIKKFPEFLEEKLLLEFNLNGKAEARPGIKI